MTGLIVSLGLLIGGIFAVYGMTVLFSPTALRQRPNTRSDPRIVVAEVNSGRGGHVTVWSVPRDDQEYAKIWSQDR